MGVGERILSRSKKILISRTRKILLTNSTFIYTCNHCRCIIFLTSGFMYRYTMLNLISPGLLNLIFSMKKALNDQNSSKQNSQTLSPPFNAIWKTPLHLLLILTLINFAYCLLAILLDITPRQKNWVLPFSFMSHPISSLITDHILEKVSLIALIQILLKILSVVHILSFKIILIWKSSLELNLLVQNSVQQNYVPDLYPCIPNLPKNVSPPFILLVAPTMYGLPCPFPQTYRLWEIL